MKFSLCHPSRGRPDLAFKNVNEWLIKSSGKHEIEHILSLDLSDKTAFYKEKFKGTKSVIVINNNYNCVQAANEAAKIATGEILIYFSDDFSSPQNWDNLLAETIRLYSLSKQLHTEPYAIWVNDGITGNKPIMTIPIISKALYKELGYLYSPEYKSMFVDEDLYWVCALRRVIINAKHLTFEHKHYTKTGIKKDATYQAHDNPQRYNEGKLIFQHRQREGFKTNGVIR